MQPLDPQPFDLAGLIPDIIPPIAQLVFACLLFLAARKRKVSAFYFIGGWLLFGGISSVIERINEALVDTTWWDGDILWAVSIIPKMLGWLMVSLFLDTLRGDKVTWWRAVLIVGLGCLDFGTWIALNPGFINLRTAGAFTWEQYENILEAAGEGNPYGLIFLVTWEFFDGLEGIVLGFLWFSIAIPMIRAIPTLRRGGERNSMILFAIFSIWFVFIGGVIQCTRNWFGLKLSFIFAFNPIIILLQLISFAYIAFWHPEIFLVISVRARRIIVIHNPSGVSLFSHEFPSGKGDRDTVDGEEIHEGLLSSLLQGLMAMSKEVIKAGVLEEIKVSGGILLLEHREHFTAAFLCDRPVSLLKEGLAKFADAFAARFEEPLSHFKGNVTTFDEAAALLPDHFSKVTPSQ